MSRKASGNKPVFGLTRGRIALIVIVLAVWWFTGPKADDPAAEPMLPAPVTVQAPSNSDGDPLTDSLTDSLADSLADSLDSSFTESGSGFEAGSLEAVQADTSTPQKATPTKTAPAATPDGSSSGWSAGSVAAAQGVSGLPTILYDDLPAQAKETIGLIDRGGPFPYYQDDQTFQNRERILPSASGDYYREYTVETPGSSDRGARRIVSGADGELYYTDDHYDSFREILR